MSDGKTSVIYDIRIIKYGRGGSAMLLFESRYNGCFER